MLFFITSLSDMFKNAKFFQFFLAILCISLITNQSYAYQSDRNVWKNSSLIRSDIREHFALVQNRVKERWQVFQADRIFIPFEFEKTDAVLEKEFENIRNVRSSVWTTSGYELAQHLIINDLVRAPGCVAFAYNNTVPYYNASTMSINDEYYIACEGPRSKDVSKFFDVLTTYQVTHLVRLTDAYEGETKKCHPYWEEHLSASADGQQLLNISTDNDVYSICAFDMSHWRDNQGVDPTQLLALVLQIKRGIRDTDSLLLIHCSAGVGRTGTFLAALAIVDAIDQGNPFSIEEIVYRLSLQRVHSVSKASQYITLHRLAERYLKEKI